MVISTQQKRTMNMLYSKLQQIISDEDLSVQINKLLIEFQQGTQQNCEIALNKLCIFHSKLSESANKNKY